METEQLDQLWNKAIVKELDSESTDVSAVWMWGVRERETVLFSPFLLRFYFIKGGSLCGPHSRQSNDPWETEGSLVQHSEVASVGSKLTSLTAPAP